MLVFLDSVCLFFFFSSRRRHTRFDCDWSSDVCSSDLVGKYLGDYVREMGISFDELMALGRKNPSDHHEPLNMAVLALRTTAHANAVRSEEHTSELQSQSNLVCL